MARRLPCFRRPIRLGDWNMIPSLVGILGLVLVILSTAAVFLTFRAGPLLEPGAEVLWKRLRPRVRGTLVLVMLAIAVVGLHDRIAPASEVLLGLILRHRLRLLIA